MGDLNDLRRRAGMPLRESDLNASGLTPGRIDGTALHTFKMGACAALAIAIHDEMGWPIYAITDHHNVHAGRVGGGSSMHWVVRRPDGAMIDIDGAHKPNDLVKEYHSYADDGQAAIGMSSREDAVEWYVEAQGEPIPIELAATFVEPVLKKAQQR